MNELVQLGGGDVYFSPVKASGYLEVNTSLEDEPLVNISIKIDGESCDLHSEIHRTKVLYRPVGNFWINQGKNGKME